MKNSKEMFYVRKNILRMGHMECHVYLNSTQTVQMWKLQRQLNPKIKEKVQNY